jgi:putative SOS response-associated peptidase YedK
VCGRYTLAYEDFSFMLEYYGLTPTTEFSYSPRYNIAPGQAVPAVVHDGQHKRIGLLRWGLVPAWAESQNIGFKTINARAETLTQRPTFRKLVERKRCLLPADGFYEWKKTDGRKQPMRIVLKSRSLFSFAGLYDTWISPAGEKLSTCTIITVKPNDLMASIHNRMPAILRREDEDAWVDRSVRNSGDITNLLSPYAAEEMTAYPVQALVGNVHNDGPECIQEVQ